MASLSVSKADVASSNNNILGFFTRARAMAILCFCPPLNCVPLSPTKVSNCCQEIKKGEIPKYIHPIFIISFVFLFMQLFQYINGFDLAGIFITDQSHQPPKSSVLLMYTATYFNMTPFL